MIPDLRYPYYDAKRQKPSDHSSIFKPFDWTSLQVLHASVLATKKEETIPTSPEIRRYFRTKAFIQHHSHTKSLDQSIQVMIQLAKDFRMSPHKAARLFVELQKLASSHRYDLELDALLKAGDAKEDLGEVVKALAKISTFSTVLLEKNAPMRKQIARHWVENEAWKWAKLEFKSVHPKQSLADEKWNKLRALGFDFQTVTDENSITTDFFGERTVVRRWLEISVLMNQWVRNAIKIQENNSTEDDSFWQSRPTAVVKMFGKVLPRIYEKYTSRSYYPSKGGGNKVLDTGGVKFIRQAMQVMGLKPSKPSTLSDHYHKANLPKSVGGGLAVRNSLSIPPVATAQLVVWSLPALEVNLS